MRQVTIQLSLSGNGTTVGPAGSWLEILAHGLAPRVLRTCGVHLGFAFWWEPSVIFRDGVWVSGYEYESA